MTESEDRSGVRHVTIEAFGKTFKNMLPGNAEDLRTLEQEGVIYAEFGDYGEEGEHLGTFTRYRIPLTPAEIYEYVEASLAEQQFAKAFRETMDFTAAVLAIEDEKYRKRVTEYGEYGSRPLKDGSVIDIRGCSASFLGPHLEGLVCGNQKDRYERLPALGNQGNQEELVHQALKSVAISARRMASRSHGRPALTVANEYDVQDLAEVALSAVFPKVEREEWTPQNAGSAKRIDLIVKDEGILIECKYVRDARHAKTVASELQVDFESYHWHPDCRRLFAYVYDPNHYIADPESFTKDLNGLRRKQDHEFLVSIVIG
ncbi:PD-(D/E)XK nuclease domain-containing protein [Streptomyces kronopolitis]